MAAIASWLFFIILGSRKVYSAVDNIPAITKRAGQSVEFSWNASVIPIIGSQWGLRDPSGNDPPNPLFLSIAFGRNVSYSNDLETVAQNYKNRVSFFGDLSKGQAWFRIINLKTNDTNQYRATIQENGQLSLPFTVSLTVLPEESTAVPMTNISSGGSPSNSSTPTPTSTLSITNATITTVPPTTEKGLSVGAIAGITIGCVFGVICIIIIVVVIYRRYKKKKETDNRPADKKEDTEMNSQPAENP